MDCVRNGKPYGDWGVKLVAHGWRCSKKKVVMLCPGVTWPGVPAGLTIEIGRLEGVEAAGSCHRGRCSRVEARQQSACQSGGAAHHPDGGHRRHFTSPRHNQHTPAQAHAAPAARQPPSRRRPACSRPAAAHACCRPPAGCAKPGLRSRGAGRGWRRGTWQEMQLQMNSWDHMKKWTKYRRQHMNVGRQLFGRRWPRLRAPLPTDRLDWTGLWTRIQPATYEREAEGASWGFRAPAGGRPARAENDKSSRNPHISHEICAENHQKGSSGQLGPLWPSEPTKNRAALIARGPLDHQGLFWSSGPLWISGAPSTRPSDYQEPVWASEALLTIRGPPNCQVWINE